MKILFYLIIFLILFLIIYVIIKNKFIQNFEIIDNYKLYGNACQAYITENNTIKTGIVKDNKCYIYNWDKNDEKKDNIKIINKGYYTIFDIFNNKLFNNEIPFKISKEYKNPNFNKNKNELKNAIIGGQDSNNNNEYICLVKIDDKYLFGTTQISNNTTCNIVDNNNFYKKNTFNLLLSKKNINIEDTDISTFKNIYTISFNNIKSNIYYNPNKLIRRIFNFNNTLQLSNENEINNLFNGTNGNFSFVTNLSIDSSEINNDYFACEYTTWLIFKETSKIQFKIASDDGSDIFYYSNNNWISITSSYGEKPESFYIGYSHTITFNPNILYPIRIRFYNFTGGKNLILQWRGNFGNINKLSFFDVNFNSSTLDDLKNKYLFICNNSSSVTNDTINLNNFPNTSLINYKNYIFENYLINRHYDSKYIIENDINKDFNANVLNFESIQIAHIQSNKYVFINNYGNMKFSLEPNGILIINNDNNYCVNLDENNKIFIKQLYNQNILKFEIIPYLSKVNTDITVLYYYIKFNNKFLKSEGNIFSLKNEISDDFYMRFDLRKDNNILNSSIMINPFIFMNKKIRMYDRYIYYNFLKKDIIDTTTNQNNATLFSYTSNENIIANINGNIKCIEHKIEDDRLYFSDYDPNKISQKWIFNLNENKIFYISNKDKTKFFNIELIMYNSSQATSIVTVNNNYLPYINYYNNIYVEDLLYNTL